MYQHVGIAVPQQTIGLIPSTSRKGVEGYLYASHPQFTVFYNTMYVIAKSYSYFHTLYLLSVYTPSLVEGQGVGFDITF